jgi:hypothetical protein
MAKKPTKTTSSFRSLQPKEQKKKRAEFTQKLKLQDLNVPKIIRRLIGDKVNERKQNQI